MFFNKDLLLQSKTAKSLYNSVKALPIVDYHCHLDASKIKGDANFSDIGELWLAGDHYKWRAMRILGVDEKYITGSASFHDKFIKYAEVLPQLIGNPLYYWTHMELQQIFGISTPLNKDTAEQIYNEANKVLQTLSVQKLLDKFNVEFVATTDDPIDDLHNHGTYGKTKVSPTFRPDKLYCLDENYIEKLGNSANITINTLDDLLNALTNRLDYFVSKGCVMSDHGFDKFPSSYATMEQAQNIFANRSKATDEQKDAFFGFILVWLAKQYKLRNITMQIHFAVTRNVNKQMFEKIGVDSGFDVISEQPQVQSVINFLQQLTDDQRPKTILYTLNDANLPAIACLTGAFRNVVMGAAWWFNDTLLGINKNLNVISEYSALGNNLGMLTDSRSFSSYCRFDFFRRILCNFVGDKVDKGEYDESTATQLVQNICYYNAKDMVK